MAAAALTESEEAGVKVGPAPAQRIKKVVPELGGRGRLIVMPSANRNNGQSCIAAKRFIGAETIADQFEKKFAQKMQELCSGDPLVGGS